jgi:hypothetical protein
MPTKTKTLAERNPGVPDGMWEKMGVNEPGVTEALGRPCVSGAMDKGRRQGAYIFILF